MRTDTAARPGHSRHSCRPIRSSYDVESRQQFKRTTHLCASSRRFCSAAAALLRSRSSCCRRLRRFSASSFSAICFSILFRRAASSRSRARRVAAWALSLKSHNIGQHSTKSTKPPGMHAAMIHKRGRPIPAFFTRYSLVLRLQTSVESHQALVTAPWGPELSLAAPWT